MTLPFPFCSIINQTDNLDDIDGEDLLKMVVEKGLDIPAIVTTGKDIVDDLILDPKWFNLHVKGFVQKGNPFWAEELKDSYRVIRFDMTSHGLTGPDPSGDYSVERTVELTDANKQLLQEIEGRKLLEREILDIGEREQRRIGQELHDSIGQQFTGIAFMTKVLAQKLAVGGSSRSRSTLRRPRTGAREPAR